MSEILGSRIRIIGLHRIYQCWLKWNRCVNCACIYISGSTMECRKTFNRSIRIDSSSSNRNHEGFLFWSAFPVIYSWKIISTLFSHQTWMFIFMPVLFGLLADGCFDVSSFNTHPQQLQWSLNTARDRVNVGLIFVIRLPPQESPQKLTSTSVTRFCVVILPVPR